MKRVFIATCIVAGLLFSARAFSQLSYGVKGGINFFRFSYKNPDHHTKHIPTFSLGGYADYQIKDEFYLRPELLFASKGSNMPGWGAKFHLSYIEIPVNFLYKYELSGGKILVGLGPYIGFAIGGKYKEGSNTEDVMFKNKPTLAEWNANWYFKPVDFGGKIAAGYEMKNGFTAALDASLGMKNLMPDVIGYTGSNVNAVIKNVGLEISVAYKIK